MMWCYTTSYGYQSYALYELIVDRPPRPVRSSLEYGIIYHRAYIEFGDPANLQVIKHTF